MTPSDWKSRLWRVGLIVTLAVSVVVYLPALTGRFIWDDRVIMDGQAIGGGRSFLACWTSPFLSNYYRPMVSTSFYLEKSIFGPTPFWFHQTNILIHLLTTAALIGAMLRLTESRRIALIAGLLFAVQPAQVGAVAWIGGRTDSQAALFMALFAWALAVAVKRPGPVSGRWVMLAAVAYAAALFTKEQVVPAILLVPLALRYFRPNSGGVTARQIAGYTTPFAAAAAGFILGYLVFGPEAPKPNPETIGYIGSQASRTAEYYGLLLLTPSMRWMHTLSLGSFVKIGGWSVLGGAAIALGCVWMLTRWRRTVPIAAWWLAFSILNLALVSNLYPVPSMLVAPYRAAVSGLGVAALGGLIFGGWLHQLATRLAARLPMTWPSPMISPNVLAGALAVAPVLWCGWLTNRGAACWIDEITIAHRFVQSDPDSISARFNYTSALLTAKRRPEAIRELGLLLDRLYGSAEWRYGGGFRSDLWRKPTVQARIHEVQGTIKSPDSWLADLFAQYGFALLEEKNHDGAALAFQSGVALYPRSTEANLGMAACLSHSGRFPEAIRRLRLVRSLDPQSVEASIRLGAAYAALGKWADARREYQFCVRRQPWAGQAYIELANAEMNLGRTRAAITVLEQGLRLSPHHEGMRRLLDRVLPLIPQRQKRIPTG